MMMSGRTIPYTIHCPFCGMENALRSGEKLQCTGCGSYIKLYVPRYSWNDHIVTATAPGRRNLKVMEDE